MRIYKIVIILAGVLIFLINIGIVEACVVESVICGLVVDLKTPKGQALDTSCSCFVECLETESNGMCGTKGKCCLYGKKGSCPDNVNPAHEGSQVWLAWGRYCYEDGCRNDLVWDPQDGAVLCSGRLEVEKNNCDMQDISPDRCEHACSSEVSGICDEEVPNSGFPDLCYGPNDDHLTINRKCKNDCTYSEQEEICDASRCGDVVSCVSVDHYCVYNVSYGWHWDRNPPSDFCCDNSDCDDCAGAATDDCDGKYLCDDPLLHPTLYTHTCYDNWCDTDDNNCGNCGKCDDGDCTNEGICYPGLNNEDCPLCPADVCIDVPDPPDNDSLLDDLADFPFIGITDQRYGDCKADCTCDVGTGDGDPCDVEITIDDPACGVCVLANPSVRIRPSSREGERGQTRTYTVEITNRDSLTCVPSTFDLTISCHSDLTCSLSQASVTINPGLMDDSTTLSATSSLSAPLGDKNISVTATNSSDNSYTGSDSAIYTVVVVAPCLPSWTGFIGQYCGPGSCGPETCIDIQMCEINHDANECGDPDEYRCIDDVICGAPAACTIESASISPNCSGGDPACEVGETINMEGKFMGDCSFDANTYFQIDAKSLDDVCGIKYSGDDIPGITQKNPPITSAPVCGAGHTDNGNGTCTATLISVPQGDGYIWLDYHGDYHLRKGSSQTEYGVDLRSGGRFQIHRAFFEWDVSSIPDDALIEEIYFIYHGNYYEGEGVIFDLAGPQPSTVTDSDDTAMEELYDECGWGWRYGEILQAGENVRVELGHSSHTYFLKEDWFGICMTPDDESRPPADWETEIHASEYLLANPKPTLEVTYALRGTISGEWSIPSIATDCLGKTVHAYSASLWDGRPGVGTLMASVSDTNPQDISPVGGSLSFGSDLPSAINLSVEEDTDYCGPWSAYFSWEFYDPNPGDTQSAYQVQIDDDLSPPLIDDSKKFNSVCNIGERDEYAPPVGTFGYNTTYYWQVRVWDSSDLPSDWSQCIIGACLLNTPEHAYPIPDFSWDPEYPVARVDTIIFSDNTIYDPAGDGGSSWEWDFDYIKPEGFTVDSTAQNPTHFYSSPGTYTVRFKACDELGCCYAPDQIIIVSLPLPGWKEVSPF